MASPILGKMADVPNLSAAEVAGATGRIHHKESEYKHGCSSPQNRIDAFSQRLKHPTSFLAPFSLPDARHCACHALYTVEQSSSLLDIISAETRLHVNSVRRDVGL